MTTQNTRPPELPVSPVAPRRRPQVRGGRPPLIVVVLAVLVALLALAPVGYLLFRGGMSLPLLLRELSGPTTGMLVTNTLLLTLGVTLTCALLGVGLGLLVVRTDLPAKPLLVVLFALPLGIPSFVGSYTWVATFYELAPRSTLIYGLPGAIIVLSLAMYPYIYLPVVAALRGLDPAQEEAARSLGLKPRAAFFRVTLPRLRTAIAGGALIIALHMFAEFGALELLRFRTLATAIVQRVTVLSAPEAARTLSLVLAVGSLALLALDLKVRGRPSAGRTGGGVARAPILWRLGRSKWLWLAASAFLLLLSLGVPLSAMAGGLVRLLVRPDAAFDWARLLAATQDTAQYALVTAVVASIVAIPVSFLAVRYPGRLALAVERSTWIAHSLPGVIVSLALVYLSVRWLYPLYQTSALLVVGYVILYLPIAIGAQQVGFAQAAPQFDNVARSLGVRSIAAFFRVTLPLALPGMAVGAVMVMLNVGKELTMTLLLHPTGTRTLATALWATTEGEVLDFAAAAPFAVSLVLITALPAFLLIRQTLRGARR